MEKTTPLYIRSVIVVFSRILTISEFPLHGLTIILCFNCHILTNYDQDVNVDELYQSPIESTQKRKLSQYSEEEQKEIACKNCNASIKKSIFYHFARTKNTSNCQKAYSANEIKYLEPGAREHTPHDDYSSGNKFHLLC